MPPVKLHLEISQIDLFKNIISLLESTCRDIINLMCMENHIEIQSMNSSTTGMTHLILYRQFFRKYIIGGNGGGFKFGIHLPTLKKIILTADKYSVITIIIREDITDKYTVIIDNYNTLLSMAEGSRGSRESKGSKESKGSRESEKTKTKKSQMISELFTFDCNEEMYGIPDIIFDSTTTIVAEEFINACTNLSKFGGEDIGFQIDSNTFIFNTKSDSGNYTLTMINSPDNTDLDICINTGREEEGEIERDYEKNNIYGVLSYKILSTGFKIGKIADVIKINISNQPSIPIKITADDAGEDDECSFTISLYFSQKNLGDDDTGAGAGARAGAGAGAGAED